MRINPALSLFAASLIAFAPLHAAAQQQQDASTSVRDRTREEYDPLGMRFGGFQLNASVDVTAESTDNVFAEETATDEDMIISVAPSARLRSTWSRHALGLDAGARFESHEDFSNEDADTSYVRGYGRLDVGARSNILASAGLAHEVEARTDADSPTGGDRVEYDRSDLSVQAQHTLNRVKLTAGVGYRDYSFDDALQAASRDNEETSLRGRIDYEATPRLGIVLQATADEREYDTNVGFNSDGLTLLAGVTFNFTDLIRGEVTAGQFERDYDNGSNVDGVAVAANVEWYPTGLTTVSFNARQNAEDVVGTTSSPFTERQYGVRVDHELLRNVILAAGVQLGEREYETIARDDEFARAEVGADYILNRRIALRARYTYDELESSGALARDDFEVNAFTLGVSFRL